MSEHLGTALARAVALFGAREAVVDEHRRWTYRELGRRVAGFDAGLDALGLRAGETVAVLSLNSAMHLLTWFAVPRSGRVLVDLNTRLAAAELELILDDCGARVLVVDDAFAATGRALAQACPSLEHLVYAGSGACPADMTGAEALTERAAVAPPAAASDTLAGIFYTGGTTGTPKGAMLTHGNLLANARHTLIAFGYESSDTYLHAAPMFHLADGATTYALTWVGGTHVINAGYDPQRWARTVQEERVTRSMLVPTMIAMLLADPAAMASDLSSLQAMLYGASPMSEQLIRTAMDALPCRWLQCYGMTEAAPVVSCLTAEDHRRGHAGDPDAVRRLRSAGRPVVGVEVEIHDPQGRAVEPGEVGEIWLRGPNVMSGYWRRPQESAAALDADGWYHSGDAAMVDDAGYVFIVDRVKDMIISGGENVYCTEVENALYDHPAVLECAVFGVPDPEWGERVHAAVHLRDGADASVEELVVHCRSRIAGFKVPRAIDLHAEPLPKSGAGKLLKRDLRAPYWTERERQVS